MKRYIFTLLISLLAFTGFSQETPPAIGPNFKQLSTSTFFMQLPDSAIWQYKGISAGWQKLSRYKDVSLLSDSAVHKRGDVIIYDKKSFLGKVYVGASTAIGTENVAFRSVITNPNVGGATVTRAGQFYATQESPQSFTGIDVLATNNTTTPIDHFYGIQSLAVNNSAAKVDRIAGNFAAINNYGDSVSIASNFYALPIYDPNDKMKYKFSFFGEIQPIYSGGGLAINTYTPKEQIDYEITAPGRGFKASNAFYGSWISNAGFAGFTNYNVKSTGTSWALLQDNVGETYLNSATGKNVFFTIGTANRGRLAPSGNWQLGGVNSATADDGKLLQVLGGVTITGLLNTNQIEGASGDFYLNYAGGGDTYIGASGALHIGSSGDAVLNGKLTVGIAPTDPFDVARKTELDLKASISSLGSNAYTSTAFLPLTGGALTGLLSVREATPVDSIVVDVGGYVRARDFIVNSDSTLKRNIRPIVNSVNDLSKLKGYRYDWKRNGSPAIGVIAQEVQKVYPEIVFRDDKGILNVDYSKLIAPLIQANNEQQKEIDQLKNDIKELKSLIKR